ncbi:C2 and GRAM domain plant-like protein, partial [Trifolium medium]|nr:C2 and GRAM domain plant-like protein [Trifolium medium]
MLKKLYVCVLEAKDLPVKNSRVKLQLGKLKYKTRISTNTFNPIWNEEFVFKVVKDIIAEEVLVVTVDNDELKVMINGDVVDFVGEVRIPVGSVGFDQDNNNKQILPPTWFSLQCSNKSARFFNKFC